ncbi:MAG: hypothetical protein JKY54_18215 [Flavobacteriales bacterium]|nr:hypothetical protein [Flavobacteriales bacterium]
MNTAQCPYCYSDGRKVKATTMRHHLKYPYSGDKLLERFHYCTEHDCAVAYFGPSKIYLVSKLQTHNQIKQNTVCYCFGITESQFLEFKSEGVESLFFDQLDYLAEVGNCKCILKNPAGTGCLKTFKSLNYSYVEHVKRIKKPALTS